MDPRDEGALYIYRNLPDTVPVGHITPAWTLKGGIAVIMRRRRLIAGVFLACVTGAVTGILIRGDRYEARMKVLVTHDRVDPAITTEPNATRMAPSGTVTEEEINSEVALLKSQDLLKAVVDRCGPHGLFNRGSNLLGRYAATDPERQTAEAVRALSRALVVEPVRKSNLIEVRYTSADRELSSRVLNTVSELYQAKHLAVHRRRGQYEFFNRQADRYRQALADAQSQLADFSSKGLSVSPHAERDLLLQRAVEVGAAQAQTSAATAGTMERTRQLETELAAIPQRLSTQSKTTDNGQLLEKLKSRLLDLELKRTELVANFAPTYRPLQQVEAEILQTKAMLTAETQKPLTEQTTDVNPTHEWISTELAKARSETALLKASADRIAATEQEYRKKMSTLEVKGYEQEDLSRNVKTLEQNYLMYAQKREEARITEALDDTKISNVAIAEAPLTPVLPTHARGTLFVIAGLLSLCVSVGAAFVSEQTDPTVRTASEIEEALNVPVLATITENHFSRAARLVHLL